MNRRDFFRQAGALGASPSVVAALIASVRRAAAIDPPSGSSFTEAEHVVILMQENRSFDHMFGALRGVRGFGDPRAITLPDGDPVWRQKNAAGEKYEPFRLGMKETRSTWLGSLPHSWPDQTDARNRGNHDRWLDVKKSHREDCAGLPLTMGYYDRRDLPFYYALADAFTICDQHFCSSLTGTTANRLYFWTGTIRAKQDVSSAPNVLNSDVDFGRTAGWKTFPERLEDAGVSWRVYQNELSVPSGLEGEAAAWLANFSDNPLEWFDQYCVQLHPGHREYLDRMSAELPDRIAKLRAAGDERDRRDERKLRDAEALQASVTAERARWTRKALEAIGPHERRLYEKAFATNADDPGYRELSTLHLPGSDMEIAKGDPLYRFRKDVAAGALPAVSWLVPSERLSDHPASPWYGAWYVSEVLNTLTKHPDVWRKTIFILTYDENDGWFDHVPPFVAPQPGHPESGRTSAGLEADLEYLPLEQDLARKPAGEARGGPIGLGFRVPLLVASPWSRGGCVCSQVFDHTSVLRFLEGAAGRWSGRTVREENISPWRRGICGDLSSAFRSFNADYPRVDFPSKDVFFGQIHRARNLAIPKAEGAGRAAQEPGTRPSLALPYDLHVNGRLTGDGAAFELEFESPKAAAPFHVYTPGLFRGRADSRTRAYAVGSGDRLVDRWDMEGFADGVYSLRVCGPNGFFREFAGSASDAGIDVVCEYEDGWGVRFQMRNQSAEPAVLIVHDESYEFYGEKTIPVAARGMSGLTFDVEPTYRWYDFSIRIAGDAQWLRRYAGRIENGRDGMSDPRIGRA